MTEQTTTNLAIQTVAVKLPEFYSHNPEGWFLNAEAQFALANIRKEKTKFYHAVKVLDAKTSEEIQHFLTEQCANTGEDSTPYTNLKEKLIKVFGRRKTSKMAELLSMTVLNEKGAESTLRRMRLLATDMDTMLQCKLLSMAPISARTAVASKEFETAEDLAAALDEAIEKERFAPFVHEHSGIASISTSTASAAESFSVSSIRPVANKKQYQAHRSNTVYKNEDKQSQERHNICFFHSRFGSKARKCSGPPCKFSDLKPQENSQAGN